jgi:putative phosphoesterase
LKVALIGDIHGNAAALEAVLQCARLQGAERILCCGDIVGYYYAPDRCLDLLSAWDVECVRGNHDDMLASIVARPELESEIRGRYGSGLRVALDVLSTAQLDYLMRLPQSKTLAIDGKKVFLGHGAPWDPGFYVYPDAAADVIDRCAQGGEDYVILGHTHHQMAMRVDDTLILNPGSVGQARGAARGVANWALLDVESGSFHHEATAYSAASLIAEAKRRDPELDYLQSILAPERQG